MPAPNTIAQVYEMLEATSSKNEKIQILKDNKDVKDLKQLIKNTLDPFKVYYTKTIPDFTPSNINITTVGSIVSMCDQLSLRNKTGKAAIKYTGYLLEQMSRVDGEFIKRMILKDLKCGMGASTVNAAWGDNFIPTFDVMLCSTYSEKNIEKLSFPVYVQEKLDGMRVIFKVTQTGVDVLSRNGKDLGLGDLFKAEMFHLIYSDNLDDKKGYVVDGELLVKQGNGSFMARKKANGILNKAIKGTLSEDESKDIYAVVWDIMPTTSFERGEYDVSYSNRFDYLNKRDQAANLTFKKDRRVTIVSTDTCDTMEDAINVYKAYIKKGSEGVIIKNMSDGWKNKRVPHQVKMKVEETADLIIKEVVGGDGKYLGKLGNFIVESACGKLSCGVGSGFSDAERTEYFTEEMVGKIIEVKYNEIISSKKADVKSLFLPIFVRMRNDKKKPDTLKKLEGK